MPFSREAMINVVRHYQEQRRQDMDCLNCRFVPQNDADDTIPTGYEPMRDYPYFVKQCEAHDVPRFLFLQDVDVDKAAAWLVGQSGEAGKPFMIDFGAWEKALNAS